MIFVDVPPEALPKFGALSPMKRPRMFFVAANSGEAARLPIKRPHRIFVDVPPEALPKFSALPPIKCPRRLVRRKAAVKPNNQKSDKEEARLVINKLDFFDLHNNHCEVCNEAGEVLCCATFNLVFHVECARSKLLEEPPINWMCAYCWVADYMGGEKDGKGWCVAKKECREMERMMRDIKEMARKRAVGEIMDIESDHEKSDDDNDCNEDHEDEYNKDDE
jgi:hypothetical protein